MGPHVLYISVALCRPEMPYADRWGPRSASGLPSQASQSVWRGPLSVWGASVSLKGSGPYSRRLRKSIFFRTSIIWYSRQHFLSFSLRNVWISTKIGIHVEFLSANGIHWHKWHWKYAILSMKFSVVHRFDLHWQGMLLSSPGCIIYIQVFQFRVTWGHQKICPNSSVCKNMFHLNFFMLF